MLIIFMSITSSTSTVEHHELDSLFLVFGLIKDYRANSLKSSAVGYLNIVKLLSKSLKGPTDILVCSHLQFINF